MGGPSTDCNPPSDESSELHTPQCYRCSHAAQKNFGSSVRSYIHPELVGGRPADLSFDVIEGADSMEGFRYRGQARGNLDVANFAPNIVSAILPVLDFSK